MANFGKLPTFCKICAAGARSQDSLDAAEFMVIWKSSTNHVLILHQRVVSSHAILKKKYFDCNLNLLIANILFCHVRRDRSRRAVYASLHYLFKPSCWNARSFSARKKGAGVVMIAPASNVVSTPHAATCTAWICNRAANREQSATLRRVENVTRFLKLSCSHTSWTLLASEYRSPEVFLQAS